MREAEIELLNWEKKQLQRSLEYWINQYKILKETAQQVSDYYKWGEMMPYLPLNQLKKIDEEGFKVIRKLKEVL